MNEATEESPALIFQDVLESYLQSPPPHQYDDDDPASLAFFELANAPEFGYRIQRCPSSFTKRSELQNDGLVLRFHQDHQSACGQHTGGIVWETSVLLLHYLLHQSVSNKNKKIASLGRVVEVGAGCGLLGQALVASLTTDQCPFLIQTETAQVLVNLQANRDRNFGKPRKRNDRILACALDWNQYQTDAAANAHLQEHSFDTLLGTDVIFTPTLVQPLLQTLDFLAKKNTNQTPTVSSLVAVVYICVQIRCATSHEQFLQLAPNYGFVVHDLTQELGQTPSTAWGLSMECHLYRLER